MEKNKVEVLIVDDSALMRSIIGKIIESSPKLCVADKAMNGLFALRKLKRADPDVILLDIEMPEMGGVEFLEELKKMNVKIPVIVLSGVAKQGAPVTMRCLELGASDFITKPGGDGSGQTLDSVAEEIIEIVYAYGIKYKIEKKGASIPRMDAFVSTQKAPVFPTPAREEPETLVPVREPGPLEIIGIGISTGGPNALREIFAQLSPNLPQPIVVVQHMPAGFTYEFAQSLDKICPLEVKEAVDGDVIKPGRVLIAPGGLHLVVEKKPLATIARVIEGPPESGHRPSVDILFESLAKEFKNRALGIIMTGMGRDGAKRLADLYVEGSRTIGQDEKSSVVYGMPRVAYNMGGVMEQIGLDDMADAINYYGETYA